MAGNVVSLHSLSTINSVSGTDRIIISRNATSNTPLLRSITANLFFSNAQVNIAVANGYYFVFTTNTTPANSSDTSNTTPTNAIWSDGSYIYVKTSNTTVKRAVLSTW